MEENKDRSYSRQEVLKKAGLGVAGALAAGALDVPRALAAEPRRAPMVLGRAQKTLHIALNGTLSPQVKNEVADFERKNPGVKLNVTTIQTADWDSFFTKVLTLIAGNQPLDLTYVATEGVQEFAAKGLSVPIDAYVAKDKSQLMEYFADVHPTLVEAMMYNGHLYQLPCEFNAVDMYFNPSLLKAAGFGAPAASWTKDQFYKMAKALVKKSGKQTVTYGYGWPIRLWGSWTPWIDVAGGDLLTFGRYPGGSAIWDTFYKDDPRAKGRSGGIKWGAPTANSSAALDALSFVVDLTKEGIAPVPDITGGNALQGFFAGNKIGMTPGGGFWAGGLHAAGMTEKTFNAQYWPTWRDPRTAFGTGGYAILKTAADKDLAWEFCKYSISKPALTFQLAGNDSTAARKSMMTAQRYAPTGPTNWDVFYPTLDRAGTRPIPAPSYYQQLNTIFTKYTSLAVTRGMTPKQALDGMQRDLESQFNSGGI